MKNNYQKNKTKPCIDENKKFAEFLRFTLRLAKKLFWLCKLVLLIFDKLPFYFYEQSKISKSSHILY